MGVGAVRREARRACGALRRIACAVVALTMVFLDTCPPGGLLPQEADTAFAAMDVNPCTSIDGRTIAMGLAWSKKESGLAGRI